MAMIQNREPTMYMKNLNKITKAIIMLGLLSTASLPAFAQDMSNGADNFYQSDSVAMQRVTFKNQYNMEVVGNLFIPKNLDKKMTHPAIVVGHPMGAVKEQSANLYATKMA
jgi:hypothetical protein